jgi:hypothetical protein
MNIAAGVFVVRNKAVSLPVIEPNDATIFKDQEQRRRQQKAAKLCVQARELGFRFVSIEVVP